MKITALLRAFSKQIEESEATANRAVKNALHLLDLGIESVVVLVAAEKDCGRTAGLIRSRRPSTCRDMRIIDPSGDNSREVLNKGVDIAKMQGSDITLVISGKAVNNMTRPTITAIRNGFADESICAVGLTLDTDLAPIIKAGFLQNTACAWRTGSLLDVGGFTSLIGVEETSVLAEQARRGFQSLILQRPDTALQLRQDDDTYRRNLTTKWERIDRELARVNAIREQITAMVKDRINLTE